MKNIFIILLIIVLAGCKTTKYVPVNSTWTEYKDREVLKVDTLIQRDSVYIRDKGDTVFIEKYKYIYKNRDVLKTDTVKIETEKEVPYPVVETKEVNKLTKWQSWQIMSFRLIIIAALLYVLYKYLSKKGILSKIISFIKGLV